MNEGELFIIHKGHNKKEAEGEPSADSFRTKDEKNVLL